MRRFDIALLSSLALVCACNGTREVEHEGYVEHILKNRLSLGVSPDSGVRLIEKDGLLFKDLNKNGSLDLYEDWRQGSADRAADLASRMSREEIAGLMLYSSHQKVFADTLSAAQLEFLGGGNIRHILLSSISTAGDCARWANKVQAFTESSPLGIPVNISSDPRHGSKSGDEFSATGGNVSKWPENLGLGASFDPEVARIFAEVASQEFRALGITTFLGPEVDMATDPRWKRCTGCYSEDPDLVTDMARAEVAGFQTTPGSGDGWGNLSVNAMVKHWPGVGTCEAGRESHHCIGKWGVYPGGNFELQLKPFTEGAFKLGGETECASAIMPGYNISYGIDPSGENVGQNFSNYIIADLLRSRYSFDGVVCTDWNVWKDWAPVPFYYEYREQDPECFHGGKSWGVEDLGVSQRVCRIIKVGCDQIGGLDDSGKVVEAWEMLSAELGEAAARERFEQSARRLLLNIFRTGLFENPYVDPSEAERIVGCPEFVKAGMDAQHKAIVMVKNAGRILPVAEKSKVYCPARHYPRTKEFFEGYGRERVECMYDRELLSQYFVVVDTPEEADFALVGIKAPETLWGFDMADVEQGGNGYVPISLQYEDYTAEYARDESIADKRSYKGKTVKTYNREDMLLVRETRRVMGNKPVVVTVDLRRPFVPSGIESSADAVLLSPKCSNAALLDLISGRCEPSGLLPMQMPADMKTVEENFEDTPRDIIPYTDSEGHVWDFGYGLDFKGVIDDARVRKYAGRH